MIGTSLCLPLSRWRNSHHSCIWAGIKWGAKEKINISANFFFFIIILALFWTLARGKKRWKVKTKTKKSAGQIFHESEKQRGKKHKWMKNNIIHKTDLLIFSAKTIKSAFFPISKPLLSNIWFHHLNKKKPHNNCWNLKVMNEIFYVGKLEFGRFHSFF